METLSLAASSGRWRECEAVENNISSLYLTFIVKASFDGSEVCCVGGVGLV